MSMDLGAAPNGGGQGGEFGKNPINFMPDLKTRITVYSLFGGLSLASLLIGFWTLMHMASAHNGYARPGLFLILSILALLVGAHGLSVRVTITDSDINYRSLFGTTCIPIPDVVSIIPISARGFKGVKISTSYSDLVIHGYSMSAGSLSDLGKTIIQRAGQAIVTPTKRQSSLPKETLWETAIVYSPFVIIWGGALIAFIIYRSRHSY